MKHSKQYFEKANKWYSSPEWRNTRQHYINDRVVKDGGMCEMCKQRLGYIVDHIIELNESNFDDTSIRLDWNNLQYLCLQCHNKKTFRKNKGLADGYILDEKGELVYIGGK